MSKASSSDSTINPNYGSISVMGRKRTMGDAITVAPGLVSAKGNLELSYYAIFHCEDKGKTATRWSERLHLLMMYHLNQGKPEEGGVDWDKVMKDSVAEMFYTEECMAMAKRWRQVDTLVAVVTEKEMVLTFKGDIRAVLFTQDGHSQPLSYDNEVDRHDRGQRGSYIYSPTVPEVMVKERTKEDEFLIMATCSLWEILSEEMMYNMTKTCLGNSIRNNKFCEGKWATAAAALLAELTMARGGQDNMSVIVVYLKEE